jgi:hypothetical protein
MPVGDYTNGERVAYPDDPERCYGNANGDQCNFKKVPGSNFCSMHGGNKALISEKKQAVNRYRLTKWQAQVERFKSDSEIKSLRDEIGILRVLMEERLNHCQTNLDLILHSGPISDLVVKIEKLVRSCHEIDKDFGSLLDKQQVLNIADQMVTILNEELKDPIVLEKIQKKFLSILVKRESTNSNEMNQGATE